MRTSTSDCRFDLGTDKYETTSISVDYEPWQTASQALNVYAGKKRRDLSGSGINTSLKDGGDLSRVGTASAGEDFDEGYFTYAVVEMAGITQKILDPVAGPLLAAAPPA